MRTTILIVLVSALCMVAKVAKADFTFGTPTEVPNVNTSSEDFNASISADGLSLYFISNRPGGVGGRDIWVTTRATTDDDWGEPMNLGPTINTPAGEWGVSISHDGLSLYFDTRQSGTSSAIDDLWVATRATTDEDWANPVNLGPTVNSSGDDYTPSISSDNLSLYFMSNRSGGYGNYDIWVTTRATTDEDWGAPVNLGPTVNSPAYELDPCISPDGRILFFTVGANNCGSRCGYGETDIWMTRRPTADDEWGEPVNLGPIINSSAWEGYPNVSADGSTLFFRASRAGRKSGGDICQAPISPIVDFSGDGLVDTVDLLMMIDCWETDASVCDIGPPPLGDGVVDVQDLIILAEYIGNDVDDPTLTAHWALDETEGMVAHDSAGTNDGTVMGVPLWQPDGGRVNGALELTGITFIMGGSVLNPSVGPFSILAWVKGGQPGQGIITQQGGVDWLMADDVDGRLATELSPALCSEAVITDGNWHRIGITWDGSACLLYVDDVLEAAGAENGLAGSTGTVVIGCRKTMAPGTFFTGLIDDVRIYSRVVNP